MIAAKLNTKKVNTPAGLSSVKSKTEKKPEKGLFESILQGAQADNRAPVKSGGTDKKSKAVNGQAKQKAEEQGGKTASTEKNEKADKKSDTSDVEKAKQKDEKKTEVEENASESKEGEKDDKEVEKVEVANPKNFSAKDIQAVSVQIEAVPADKMAATDKKTTDNNSGDKKNDQQAIDEITDKTQNSSNKVSQSAPVKGAAVNTNSQKTEPVDSKEDKKSQKITSDTPKEKDESSIETSIPASVKETVDADVDDEKAADNKGKNAEQVIKTDKNVATDESSATIPKDVDKSASTEKRINTETNTDQEKDKNKQLSNGDASSDQKLKNGDSKKVRAQKAETRKEKVAPVPDSAKVHKQKAEVDKKVRTSAEDGKNESVDKTESAGDSKDGTSAKSIKKAQNSQIINENSQIRNIKAEQLRNKKYRDHLASFARPGESDSTKAGDEKSRKSYDTNFVDPIISASQPETSGDNIVKVTDANDADIFWKNHIVEASGGKEHKATEQSTANFMRLGQIPVSNISLKRSALPTITQKILKAVGGKSVKEVWQKHSFVLEDGKNIHLSARQVDGVMQLKLSSSHAELKQLLQQHYQEIKKHLEQELNLQVDLQFDANSEQDMSGFFGDSSSFGNRGQGSKSFSGKGTGAGPIKTDPQILLKTVRKFGYNQMEWTA